MPEKYGTAERATLILLTLHGELPNPRLRNDYGVDLGPTGRERLNKDGLISTRSENRSYVHTITKAGVAWCEQELTTIEAPQRSGPVPRAGFEALRRMATYFQRQGISLADVLHTADGDGLETLIRKAYDELSARPQDWVRLAKLRPKLNGADKEEVDKVLKEMTKTGLVHLAPDSNRKVLTEADHAAAIKIGSENKHLLAIEDS